MILKTKLLFYTLLFAFNISCNAQSSDGYIIFEHYVPSGYMGDTKNIIVRQNFIDGVRPDSLCTKISYSSGVNGWGGVFWQYPANNWCTLKGVDLSSGGYRKLTFYVKGDKGGEEIKFKSGQDCGDSYNSEELTNRITKEWTKLTINLEGKDFSNISGAFCWVVDSKANNNGNVTFYIDDVKFEK